MQKWKLSLGLAATAAGAALIVPRLFPAVAQSHPVPPAPDVTEPTPVVVDEPIPTPTPEPRTIDVVVALDTSGSMNALIDSVRARLWDLVNEVDRLDPDATLRVGLVTYGSPAYGQENGFVRVNMDLTTDLDALYTAIWDVNINGGDEYVGSTIDRSLSKMSWNEGGGDNRKLLFVAGNETAFLGPIDPIGAANRAVSSGVIVNTLYAGPDSRGRAEGWDRVAQAGAGRFIAIDASQSAVAVATPYDAQLESMNTRLNNTYMNYSHRGKGKLDAMIGNDLRASSLGSGSVASRISTKSTGKFDNRHWDLVDAVNTGSIAANDVDRTALPAAMQNLDDTKLKAEVKRLDTERKQAQREIQDIQQKRSAWIRDQAEQQAGSGLDEAMGDMLSTQL